MGRLIDPLHRDLFISWAGLPPDAPGIEALDAWEFHAYERGGETQAVAAVQGTEIHFAIAPHWRRRLICRQRTREFLAPLFERFGYLTTRSIPSQENNVFLSRLGFIETWNDGKYSHWMMCELPFENLLGNIASA